MPFTSCSSLFCLCRQEQMLKNCMAAKCRHASWQKPQPFRSSVRYVLMNTNKHKFVSPGWINSLGEYGKFELIRRQKLLYPLHRNRRSFRTCLETVSTQSVNCTADKALSESVRVDTSIDSVCFGCSSQNLLSLSNSGCALQVAYVIPCKVTATNGLKRYRILCEFFSSSNTCLSSKTTVNDKVMYTHHGPRRRWCHSFIHLFAQNHKYN